MKNASKQKAQRIKSVPYCIRIIWNYYDLNTLKIPHKKRKMIFNLLLVRKINKKTYYGRENYSKQLSYWTFFQIPKGLRKNK